jgi:hypothetical protein
MLRAYLEIDPALKVFPPAINPAGKNHAFCRRQSTLASPQLFAAKLTTGQID